VARITNRAAKASYLVGKLDQELAGGQSGRFLATKLVRKVTDL
jgi:hypothetical protein